MCFPLDVDIFVQNIKNICKNRGTNPTAACDGSGAGRNFMDNIKKGSIPSVAKVQMLASYLGVTVSQLLGEDASDISQGPAQPYLVFRYNQLPPEDQKDVMEYIEFKFTQMEKNKASKQDASTR